MDHILNGLRMQPNIVWPDPNPFYHRVKINKFKLIIMSIFVAPIRFVLAGVTFGLSIIVAKLLMAGLTDDDILNRPCFDSWWRRPLRYVFFRCFFRAPFFFGGFHWVHIKGERATRDQAPVIVGAPHSSFIDSIAMIYLNGPSTIARSNAKDIPIIGPGFGVTQPIYVTREDKDSRDSVLHYVVERVTDPHGWTQVFIYSEGSCSNRCGLLSFKKGAFAPKKPVQPFVIRYGNQVDTFSWAFDGIPVWKIIWYTLCNFHNSLTIEYLPVYTPNAAEENDADLYAENVRSVFSRALGMPKTPYTMKEGWLFKRMGNDGIRPLLRSLLAARKALGIKPDDKMDGEMLILREVYMGNRESLFISFDEAKFMLRVLKKDDDKLEKLFLVYGKSRGDLLDIKVHVFYCLLLHPKFALEDLTEILFIMYANWMDRMTRNQFVELMMQFWMEPETVYQKLFDKHKNTEVPGVAGAPERNPQEQTEDFLTLEGFAAAIKMWIDFIKMFALEVLGLTEEYPKHPLPPLPRIVQSVNSK